MRLRVHLAVALFLTLVFYKHVIYTTTFVITLFVATLLPNVDHVFDGSGRRFFLKPLKIFLKRRGFLHSFTFAFLVTVFLAFYYPKISLPFFLGYGMHLLVDSWTKEGILPFWPYHKRVSGRVEPGKKLEETIFSSVVVVDIVLILFLSLT